MSKKENKKAELIKTNRLIKNKTEKELLEIVGDYFSLTEASTPISFLNQLTGSFVEHPDYKDFDHLFIGNLSFNINELILLLSKLQEKFNKIDKCETILEYSKVA
jgi:hypothetical protein